MIRVFGCPATCGAIRCGRVRFHRGAHAGRSGAVRTIWGRYANSLHTFEVDQPWVTYLYLSTDRETRVTGRSRVQAHCLICGDRTTLRAKIPRIGPVPEPASGRHFLRERYLRQHAHPGLQDPRDWAEPLGNPAAWPGGIPLDVFSNVARTARIEANEREQGQ